MMNETHILITLAAIHLIALMSPGPDFALVVQNATRHGRSTGLFIALGLSAGILTHSILSVMGISLLLHQHPSLFSLVQCCGGGYLLYIGVCTLKHFIYHPQKASQRQQATAVDAIETEPAESLVLLPQIPYRRHAFTRGFLTNILNPKALVFFISLMSGLIPSDFSWSGRMMGLFILWSLSFLWFAMLAWLLSTQRIQQKIQSVTHYIDALCGFILSAIGLLIATQACISLLELITNR